MRATRYLIVRGPDGSPMHVMRSKNPKLAVRLAKEAAARGGPADFGAIMEQCGGAEPVGYFGRYGLLTAVVNGDGEKIGDIEPGDSFATLLN